LRDESSTEAVRKRWERTGDEHADDEHTTRKNEGEGVGSDSEGGGRAELRGTRKHTGRNGGRRETQRKREKENAHSPYRQERARASQKALL
jgi:hypothetical protein